MVASCLLLGVLKIKNKSHRKNQSEKKEVLSRTYNNTTKKKLGRKRPKKEPSNTQHLGKRRPKERSEKQQHSEQLKEPN